MGQKPETDQLATLLQAGLQDGRQATLTVTSNSMSPLIRRGDQVWIVAASRPLQPGDIITFRSADGLLTHRFGGYVPGVGPLLMITRGDKPVLFDAPTQAANLVGQVIGRQRHGRWLHLLHGRGLWLNRHLAHLAVVDNRVLAGGRPLPQMAGLRPARWRQGVHWLLQLWATTVTAVVTWSAGNAPDTSAPPPG